MRLDYNSAVLTAATVAFCIAAAAVTWIGFGQPRGMIHGIVYGETDTLQRLWPLVTLAVLSVGLAAVFISQNVTSRVLTTAPSKNILKTTCVALVLGGVAASLLAVRALRAIPFSADEYDYVYQAETFLRGRLWNPLLPGHEFFSFLWLIEKAGKWLSSFPPGWPLLLAGAHLLKLPFWAVSPLLGAITLVFLAKLAAREDGPAASVVALALVVFSPFFVFNAGSFYSHVPTAAFGLIFCYFGVKFIDLPRWRSAALAGTALGVVGVIRPFDTLIYAVPFAIEWLIKPKRRRAGAIAIMVMAGLPWLAGLLFYTRAITGSAFVPVQVWAYSSLPIGLDSTNLQGHQITSFQELLFVKTRMAMLAEWVSPIFMLSYLGCLAWKTFQRKARFYDFAVISAIVAYLFVHTDMGGDEYGPRFYVEGFMLMPLTISSAIVGLIRERKPVTGAAVAGLTVAHILTCLAGLAVLLVYMRKVVDDRFDIYHQVREAGLHHAVVLVHRSDIFARNGLDRDGNVIYALNLPGRIDELHGLFPDRRIYLYMRSDPETPGKLYPLRLAPASP